VITAKTVAAGAPAKMVVSHCPVERGQMLPLAIPCRQPGGVLLRTSGCLGFLLVVALIPACRLV
jgi:hypothetical protein